MTMDEFLKLSAKEMLDVIKTDPEYRQNKAAFKAFSDKAKAEGEEREEIWKKKCIEQHGYYIPSYCIDPLPRKRPEKNKENDR